MEENQPLPAALQSAEIGELAGSLAKAQSEMGAALKSSDNPYFKSSYADLAAVIEAARPLSDHGLSISQMPVGDDLVTLLMHSSGQWIRSTYPIRAVKNDPQARGSAITYARRYAYQSICGLASADDDGEAAMGRTEPTTTVKTTVTKKAPTTTGSWKDYVLDFGKHQGKRLGDIDLGYIQYLLKGDNSKRPDLEEALKGAERELGTANTGFTPSKAMDNPVPESQDLFEDDDVPF
tara:strand:- start:939 stop:1646 length:708 start_codon:yes stop_codon:yes gene_type:complete